MPHLVACMSVKQKSHLLFWHLLHLCVIVLTLGSPFFWENTESRWSAKTATQLPSQIIHDVYSCKKQAHRFFSFLSYSVLIMNRPQESPHKISSSVWICTGALASHTDSPIIRAVLQLYLPLWSLHDPSRDPSFPTEFPI